VVGLLNLLIVSILVLMDVALKLPLPLAWLISGEVSILVLMDVALKL